MNKENFIKIAGFNAKHAFFTKNLAGSTSQYAYNDDTELNTKLIMDNRQIAMENFGRDKQDVVILKQIHSNKVLVISDENWQESQEYDAVVTQLPKLALGILTADCVPILFSDSESRIIAAAHAGWRGAFSGVIENTINEMQKLGAKNIIAAIGPCIRQKSYEVDNEFYNKFLEQDINNEDLFINSVKSGHFMFDVPEYVKRKLAKLQVKEIYDCDIDNFTDERFVSYRRCIKENNKYKSNILSVISL